MAVFSEKPSLSDRKTYFIWDKPTLSNYCDNGLPYTYIIFEKKNESHKALQIFIMFVKPL